MEAVRAFLDDCRLRNLRSSTIDQKRRCLTRLARVVDPLEATTDDLRAHLARPMMAESRATELSHLKSFYKFCLLEGLVDRDPTIRIQRPKVPRRLPRPMPEDDLEMALDLAGQEVRTILMLAGFAGLRAKEIAGLRGEHVLWEHDPPMLLIVEQKGGGESAVPVCSYLAGQLALLPRSGWMFPRHDGNPGPTPPWLISRRANRFLHSIGIGHTLHSARHRYGTKVYRSSGRDLRLTQDLMRHASPVSTALYTWCDPEEGARAVEALPTFG